MLELARLKGTPQKSIVLQTRAGRNVDNCQSSEPEGKIHSDYKQLRSEHFQWKNRKPACGIYNCFGLVWANRRTSIYDETEISKILTDDGYRRLENELYLWLGDIVLYLLPTGRMRYTLHASIVLQLETVGGATIPLVLSKWSDVFGEDIHALRDLPKGEHYRDCLVEFWTDRP